MQGSHSTASRRARLVGLTRRMLGAALVALMAATAAAQDYTVTAVSGQYVTPPTSGTTDVLGNIGNKDDGTYTISPLPFTIPYFGVGVTQITVSTNCVAYMNNTSGYAYGYSPVALPQSSTYDGIIKIAMTDGDGRGSSAKLLYWVDGNAPNRRLIITWLNWQHYSLTGSATFQAQFYESGRIQLAYTSGWSWGYSSGVGIDAPSPDSRWAAPNNSSNYTFSGTPANDWRFEPDITNITGTVNIAEVVSDATGFGNSSASPHPASGLKLELQSGGVSSGSGYLGDDGAFTVAGVALNSSNSGSIVLVSETLGCRVSPSTATVTAAAYTAPVAQDVEYGSDSDVGDYTLDDNNDPNLTIRAPMQIATTIESIRSWVQTATGRTIPRIEVYYDPNNSNPSRYTPAGVTTPASIRIAGTAAANPDAFDGAVVARVYMRHVLASLTGAAPTGFSQSLDVATTADEAFADALGLYVYAAVTGQSVVYDGSSKSSTTAFDLESPSLTRTPGPTVAGWAAAALYDLLDGANEDWDVVDGTSGSNASRVFQVIGGLSGTVTPAAFLDGWVNRGYSGSELVTDFIHHGVLPDDVNEPNDTLAQAQSLGVAGLRATGKTLNRYNQDWYRFTLQQAAPVFFVEMVYDRYLTAAVVDMRVFRADGTLISVGSPDGDNGPIKSTLTNLAAGDYLVQLTHVSGSTITSYEMQIYAQMSLALATTPAWTVGKRIQQPLDLFGGIPPYTVLAKDAAGDPFSAIQFIPSQGSAPFDFVWTPKEVGVVTIQVVSTDSGSPTHSRTLNLAFVVNPELAFSAPELTGVALDKQADVNLGRVGGTDPITLSDQFGDLPGGLSVTDDFRIQGTASEPGGGAFGFTATDVAGSEASVDSFLVVCVPIETKKQPVPLAAGQAAAGFYFDALSGSNVSMQLKTSKKRAKRELNFLVIGPDGNVVQGGSAKIKAGSVSIKGLTAPTTGRYFMAFASDDGGAETELQGTLKLQLPKKGAGGFERMELGQPNAYEFGALAGATLDVKGKTTDGMEIRVLFIIQPDATVVPFDDVAVTNNNGKVTIKTKPLSQSGTYTLVVAAQKTDLADFSFKVKLKQPSGAFSLDD